MTSTRSSRKRRVRSGFRAAFGWYWRKNRVLAGLYTLVVMVALPCSFFLSLTNEMDYYTSTVDQFEALGWMEIRLARTMTENLSGIFVGWGVPLMTLCALLLAVSSFGYLHNRRSVDLYNALPVRRTPMLLGGVAANLVQLFLPMAAACAIIHALGRGYADLVYPFSGILVWEGFGVLVLTMTAAYLLFLFMIVISGTLLDAGFSYAVLCFGWPVFWLCAETLCRMMLPGYAEEFSNELYLAFLPYIAGMLPFINYDSAYCFPDFEGYEGALPKVDTHAIPYQMSVASLIWWIFFVAALFVLVIVVFRIRKSEYAESSASFLLPRAVFRLIGSAAGGLGLGLIFGMITSSNLVLAVGILLGSFLTHLITQAVWARGLRQFWRTLPAYVVLLALLTGAGVVAAYDAVGYVTYTPSAADVESVQVEFYGVGSGSSKESYLAQQAGLNAFLVFEEDDDYQDSYYLAPRLWQQESIEAVIDLHQKSAGQFRAPYLPFTTAYTGEYTGDDITLGGLDITYYLKDGSTIHRYYNELPWDKAMEQAAAAVTGLAEYQLYSLFDQYTADSIESIYYDVSLVYDIDIFDTDAWEEMLNWEDEAGGYRQDLTDEEKQTLWETFLRELNSEDFANGASSEEAVKETGYWEDYTINVTGSIPKSDFSPELETLLRNALGAEYDAVTEVQGESIYTIPASCTETRALIRSYIAKNGEADAPDGEDGEDAEGTQESQDTQDTEE